MPLFILLFTLGIVLLYFGVRWLKTASKHDLHAALIIAIAASGATLAIILIITGRIYPALGGLTILTPFLVLWWRRRKKRAPPRYLKNPMSLDEACEILGVTPDATDAEIKTAYRILMHKSDPSEETHQLKRAKDVLLNRPRG